MRSKNKYGCVFTEFFSTKIKYFNYQVIYDIEVLSVVMILKFPKRTDILGIFRANKASN